MNYGRKNTSKWHMKVQSKAAMKKNKRGVRIFKMCLFGCLALGVIGIITGGLLFK